MTERDEIMKELEELRDLGAKATTEKLARRAELCHEKAIRHLHKMESENIESANYVHDSPTLNKLSLHDIDNPTSTDELYQPNTYEQLPKGSYHIPEETAPIPTYGETSLLILNTTTRTQKKPQRNQYYIIDAFRQVNLQKVNAKECIEPCNYFREALGIYRGLVVKQPKDYWGDCANTAFEYARLLRAIGRQSEAKRLFQEAHQNWQRLSDNSQSGTDGKWIGKKLSEDNLRRVLDAHKTWLASNQKKGAKANLRWARLVDSDLSMAVLFEAGLENADLEGAVLKEAELGFARMTGCKLSRADLRGANLIGANLEGADLRWACLQGADLFGANLHGANLQHAEFQGASLDSANLSETQGLVLPNLAGADLGAADLPREAAKFNSTESVVRSSEAARKLTDLIYLACFAVVWMSFAGPQDPGKGFKLPFVDLWVPETYFAWIVPLILLVGFFFIQYYLSLTWAGLATLPAVFPDKAPLYRHPQSWFAISCIRRHMDRLNNSLIDKAFWILAELYLWIPIPLTILLMAHAVSLHLKAPYHPIGSLHQTKALWAYQEVLFFFSVWVSLTNRDRARRVLRDLGRGDFKKSSAVWKTLARTASVVMPFYVLCCVVAGLGWQAGGPWWTDACRAVLNAASLLFP